MARRTLVIARHAKAETQASSDHARDLTDRGRSDAAAVGRSLQTGGLRPQQALVSDAHRTLATWQAIAEAGAFDCLVKSSGPLYAASPEAAIDLIRETDDSVDTLVVVGHNPTMSYLALALDDGEGNAAASDAMTPGFPTASYAVFSVTGSWYDLRTASASLVDFRVGRG